MMMYLYIQYMVRGHSTYNVLGVENVTWTKFKIDHGTNNVLRVENVTLTKYKIDIVLVLGVENVTFEKCTFANVTFSTALRKI